MNLARRLRVVATLAVAIALQACATLDQKPREAASSGACARAAVAGIDEHATGDKRAHCLGAARIAQRCSVTEAVLASYAKEVRDLFGRGNAEFADLRAGRAGIACARAHAAAAAEQARCCEARGFARNMGN